MSGLIAFHERCVGFRAGALQYRLVLPESPAACAQPFCSYPARGESDVGLPEMQGGLYYVQEAWPWPVVGEARGHTVAANGGRRSRDQRCRGLWSAISRAALRPGLAAWQQPRRTQHLEMTMGSLARDCQCGRGNGRSNNLLPTRSGHGAARPTSTPHSRRQPLHAHPSTGADAGTQGAAVRAGRQG